MGIMNSTLCSCISEPIAGNGDVPNIPETKRMNVLGDFAGEVLENPKLTTLEDISLDSRPGYKKLDYGNSWPYLIQIKGRTMVSGNKESVKPNIGNYECPFEKKFAMFVMPGFLVKQMPSMIPHEQAKEKGYLVQIKNSVTKSYEQVNERSRIETTPNGRLYRGKITTNCYWHVITLANEEEVVMHPQSKIIFFSHCWSRPSRDPSVAHPDDAENSKLSAIKKNIRDEDYVWLDFWSIPQRERKSQQDAIESLPFYAYQSTELIRLIDAENPAKYFSRGWTNLEALVALTPILRERKVGVSKTSYQYEKSCNVGQAFYNLKWVRNIEKKELPVKNPLLLDYTDPSDKEKVQVLVDMIKEKTKTVLRALEHTGTSAYADSAYNEDGSALQIADILKLEHRLGAAKRKSNFISVRGEFT